MEKKKNNTRKCKVFSVFSPANVNMAEILFLRKKKKDGHSFSTFFRTPRDTDLEDLNIYSVQRFNPLQFWWSTTNRI